MDDRVTEMDEILEYRGPDRKNFDKLVKQVFTGLNSKENESLLFKKMDKILISDLDKFKDLINYAEESRKESYL